MQHEHPDYHLVRAVSRSFERAVVGDVRPVIVVLTLAVALLLVIACVNVANLLLLRASSRGRELTIRRALGASHADIGRQLLVESLVLAVSGGVLGLLCAMGCCAYCWRSPQRSFRVRTSCDWMARHLASPSR